MRHHTTPGEPPLPREHSGLTKGNKHFSTSGLLVLSYSSSAFLSAFPKAARSQNYRAFRVLNAFPNVQTTRPKPNRMPEAKASLQRQTYAWMLSTCPNTNLYPMPEPYYCESPALWLIAESGLLKNTNYVSGIHHFLHKGQTRTFWKKENEVGAGRALKKWERREGNGRRRSVRNGREVKRRK